MHLLQSPPWGAFKSQFGWSCRTHTLPHHPIPIQVLYRRLPLGLNIAYLPKGPAIDWDNADTVQETLAALKSIAAQPLTLFLKIEPDTHHKPEIRQSILNAGYRVARPIQPVSTILIDLTPSEDDILARMKSKTRYNIRLAARKGVTVRRGGPADVKTFYELSRTTGERDGFAPHSLAYYQGCYNAFADHQRVLLLAEYEGQPLAGLMVFAWDDRAYYLYGASNNQHRNKMPAYLLQWEAISWAIAQGCRDYDLWGIPNAPLERLEAGFQNRADGLWGVYRHKRGYGGQIVRYLGAFDYVAPTQPHKQLIYYLFSRLIEHRSPQTT